MEHKNKVISFQIRSIVLTEQSFKRIPIINFEPGDDTKNDFNVNLDVTIDEVERSVLTQLTINYIQSYKGQGEVNASITYLGSFIQTGEYDNTIEFFANVNAPAVIYPYIREQLSLLSMKAGVKPIFLPTVNFARIYKDKLFEKSE